VVRRARSGGRRLTGRSRARVTWTTRSVIRSPDREQPADRSFERSPRASGARTIYAGDTGAGQTNGQDLNQFGASWYVLSAAGDKVEQAGS
jgi:hypothetical protein